MRLGIKALNFILIQLHFRQRDHFVLEILLAIQ